MANAGRVAIVPKGKYVHGTKYTRLDMVYYQNGTYVAKRDNVSVYPTVGVDSNDWMFMGEMSPLMTGATSSTAGTAGLVPAPMAGENYSLLMGDGKWSKGSFGGRNLYVVPDSVEGYISTNDGSILKQDDVRNEYASDFIPVSKDEEYIFQNWVTPILISTRDYLWMAYAFYDDSKNFISPRTVFYDSSGNKKHHTMKIIVPDNAAYLRVSARMYEDGKIKLERGSIPTDWTPAPEDLESKIEEKVKEFITPQIFYGVCESPRETLSKLFEVDADIEEAKKIPGTMFYIMMNDGNIGIVTDFLLKGNDSGAEPEQYIVGTSSDMPSNYWEWGSYSIIPFISTGNDIVCAVPYFKD